MRIENRQVKTLFGVVGLFLFGNTLRIFLNIDEAIQDYDTVSISGVLRLSRKEVLLRSQSGATLQIDVGLNPGTGVLGGRKNCSKK